MKRKSVFLLAVPAVVLVLAAVWWSTRSSPATGDSLRDAAASGGPGSLDRTAPPAPPVAARLDALRVRLQASRDPATSRQVLAEFRQLLDALAPQDASQAVQAMLAAGHDGPTHLDVTIEPGGRLADASSLRVFLLDYLGWIDRAAAGALAGQILAQYTTPDEWAVSLRNYAWANPGPAGAAYLQAKARQLLGNASWAGDPSAGFLEAFDAIVYARGTALLPELAALLQDRDHRATAHAAYLTLDRLTINEPAIMLQQLVDEPGLLSGREPTRAGLFARADVRDPAQRTLVEQYLLDPRRDRAELAAFAGVYPNANFMVSHNLLTTVETLPGGQLAAHDRAALQVVEQWQQDPRFERLQPLLARLHERLATFVRQAAGNGP